MLPSTGYFKGINCPFYDSGSCERPYCHFRHVRKDPSASSTQSDGIESGAILQKLVSAAVQKVLQQSESSTIGPNNQVARIEDDIVCNVNNAQSKATYNPTPIAELNKINQSEAENNEEGFEQRRRHIPVPYTPRKPTSLPIKRPIESNGSPQAYIYLPPPAKYTPGSAESAILDPYTPKGSVESTEKYLPGTEKELQEYTIKESHTTSRHNYVPSDKNPNKKRLLEYKPTKVSSKSELPAVTYQPTPKALVPCFSSDEDEPDPKKAKLSADLDVDDLRPEFDILDQILDEEKLDENDIEALSKKIGILSKESEKKHKDENKTHRKSSEKHNSKKSSHKSVDKKPEKHDDKKSEKHNDKKSEKHDDNKSEKHENKKSEKHIDKKPSSKHEDKKSSAKYDDKKAQEKIKSDKKDKLSSHSKSDSKSGESNKKSHKSSKEKSKNDKSDKEKNSDSKSTDKSTKSTKHSTSRSSDRHEKDHKSSNHSSKSSKEHKNSSSNHDSKHAKDHKSSSVKHDSKRKSNSASHKSSKKSRETHRKEKVSSHNISDNDHYMSADEIELDKNEESISDISESDEESRALECMRIFEEYVPTEKPVDNVDFSHNDVNNESEFTPLPGKKRVSHTTDKNVKVLPKAPLKPDYKVSAAQAMAERLAKVKEYHASKHLVATSNTITPVSKPEPIKSSVNFSNPTSTKVRIAHVPYASTLVNAKKGITPTQKSKLEEPSTSFTTIQTVKKGVQRVAHIPNEKFIDRPGVLEPLASKIPANIRSTYLNMMIDECLKIYLSATDAYARAQHEELTTSKKCSTVQIYKNSAVLTVSRLRKEFQECNGIKKSGADCSVFQKVPHLASNMSNLGSWSIESKRMWNSSGEFSGAKFFNNIKKWVLTEEQLQENGFPRLHSSGEKGRAIIYGQNKQIPPKGLIRTCCRCKKDYIVDKKGFPAIKEECIYHPNNKYRVRGEVKYQCCSQDNSSDGCCVAPCHVYEYVDFDNLKGFIKTMPPDHKMDDYGVYSLDCEMCYTTHGLDLTRVTVINSECKVVYETLIKPLHPIIDYNTRYSGITEEQMANVKTTLLEVQATLLSMFNSESILVGHSLESDFKALKLIHDTVIDTSVLFPHKMGPPYKRALRNLSSEYLKKIIQNSVDGHDSAEDATVCMELLIYKLKEDLKMR